MAFTITSPPRRNCFHSSGVTKPNVVMETSTSLLRVWYGEIFYEQANYFQEPEVSENKAWEWNN